MKKLWGYIAIAFLLVDPSTTMAQARPSYQACLARASVDNAQLPMRIDRGTTVVGVSCREENGRIIFIYDNQLDIRRKEIPSDWLSRQAVATGAMLCTNPSLTQLLRNFDMEYVYYDYANNFVGRITNRIEDCSLN